jgi:hypothetical protein
MLHPIIQILILEFIAIAIIIVYGHYRCKNKNFTDPLGHKIPIGDLDGWSLDHILWNFILGYFFPKYILFILFLGILWELFETYCGIYKPDFLNNWGYCTTDKKNNDKVWWYGKFSDIICNLTGVLLGSYVSTLK